MNNIKALAIYAMTTLLAASCGSEGPADVAINFSNAMAEAVESKDLQQAKSYTDPNNHALLEMGLNMREQMDPDGEVDSGPWTVVSENIAEDKATVMLKSITTGKEEDLTLRRIDGEWKIYMDKNR